MRRLLPALVLALGLAAPVSADDGSIVITLEERQRIIDEYTDLLRKIDVLEKQLSHIRAKSGCV